MKHKQIIFTLDARDTFYEQLNGKLRTKLSMLIIKKNEYLFVSLSHNMLNSIIKP